MGARLPPKLPPEITLQYFVRYKQVQITKAIEKHHTKWRRVHIVRHSSAGAGILYPGPHAIPPNQTTPFLRVGTVLSLDVELSLNDPTHSLRWSFALLQRTPPEAVQPTLSTQP